MKQIIVITITFWTGWFFGYSTSDLRIEKYEAGKRFVRDSLIQEVDNILGCSNNGYIPDTISVKSELKNGGSYKFKGKGM
jgi:hypothetical protein